MVNSFPWSSAIWNSDSRRDPPARLAEVLPSPTTETPPALSAAQQDPDLFATAFVREPVQDANIPFPIPLHPTPKSYRSQSYSVGQLDNETDGAVPAHPTAAAFSPSRVKAGQPSGLQHRPSRPSMLSERSHDTPSSLSLVREDGDAPQPMVQGGRPPARTASEASTLEHLSRENARLRQVAATNQLENMRLRTRAASATAGPLSAAQNLAGIGHRIQRSVPEESDYAVDEVDDLNELHTFVHPAFSARRFSEFGPDPDGRYGAAKALPENRQIESLKKGQWQSSLGFGGAAQGQQSRRHSFADVPARNHSIGSAGVDTVDADLGRALPAGRGEKSGRFADGTGRLSRTEHASYFTGTSPISRGGAGLSHAAASTYALSGHHGSDRAQSPLGGLQRGVLGTPVPVTSAQPRPPNQLLCIVTFKCLRAEVFYVQEGTGLQVKSGDMVIVEADRGTDLGTVVDANVTWDRAKELKEHYAEEHYKWLMMFSRHGAQMGNGPGLNPSGPPYGRGTPGSAVGGMGPPGGHNGMQDVNPTGELRPKLIKRLAQNHEIQTLRDKEGNEAKAKRVCQQKVAEHRLQMEILDAEFQMDWKKLTFYYFADAYINFNSLVTELFKVYKTRIWMSAINPASFASLSLGLPSVGAIGPAGPAFGRQSPYRQQQDPLYGGTTPFHAYRHALMPASETSPMGDVAPTNGAPNPYAYAFPPFGPIPRPTAGLADFVPALPRPGDTPIEFRSIEFGDVRNGHIQKGSDRLGAGAKGAHQVNPEAWVSSFQGLSLHSH